MSHFTTITTQVMDMEALQDACVELGVAMHTDAIARGFANHTYPGEFVITLPGPYDIAVNKQADGTYGFTADLWRGHVEQVVGEHFGTLLQLYGVHAATRAAKRRGHRVSRTKLDNGTIKLTIGG